MSLFHDCIPHKVNFLHEHRLNRFVLHFIMNFINVICIFVFVLPFPNINADYPALEVILEGDTISLPRDDLNLDKMQLEKSQYFLYLCLPESKAKEELIEKLGIPGCLFPKVGHKKRQNVRCQKKVVPLRRMTTNRCGKNDMGTVYHVHYNICFKNIYGWDVDLMPEIDNLMTDITNAPDDNVSGPWMTVHVYSICFYRESFETAFVQYEISSVRSSTQQPKSPMTAKMVGFLNKTTGSKPNPFELEDLSQCYEKDNQKQARNFMRTDDHLAPQLLLSSDDIPKQFAGGAIDSHFNIRPQWATLQEHWKALNAAIKEKSREEWLTSFDDSRNSTHVGFVVYSGTYRKLENESNQPIRIGNVKLEKVAETDYSEEMTVPLLKESEEEGTSVTKCSTTVPLFWWKLVTTRSQFAGMVLVMLNYSTKCAKRADNIMQSLCTDICAMHGWDFVKSISSQIICCKPTKQLLRELFNNYIEIENENVLNLYSLSPRLTEFSRTGNFVVSLITQLTNAQRKLNKNEKKEIERMKAYVEDRRASEPSSSGTKP